jgi:Ran GTPase-activating protein 1
VWKNDEPEDHWGLGELDELKGEDSEEDDDEVAEEAEEEEEQEKLLKDADKAEDAKVSRKRTLK